MPAQRWFLTVTNMYLYSTHTPTHYPVLQRKIFLSHEPKKSSGFIWPFSSMQSTTTHCLVCNIPLLSNSTSVISYISQNHFHHPPTNMPGLIQHCLYEGVYRNGDRVGDNDSNSKSSPVCPLLKTQHVFWLCCIKVF